MNLQFINRELQKIYKLDEETTKRVRIIVMDGWIGEEIKKGIRTIIWGKTKIIKNIERTLIEQGNSKCQKEVRR